MYTSNLKPKNVSNDEQSVNFEVNQTSEEIYNKFSVRPATKLESWMTANCYPTEYPRIPNKALNGYNGGLPVKTTDNKVIRLSKHANQELNALGAIKEIRKNIEINGE